MTQASIKILLVDDHPIIREGVTFMIQSQPDLAVIGEAEDGEAAVEAYGRLRPDITLMDLQMPKLDGVEAIRKIRAMDPEAQILVLTTYAGDAKALSALKAGAVGYLLKSAIRNEMVEAIRAAHRGERHLPASVAKDIALTRSETC
ncbi:response regulator [Sphingomonas arvum]|uniref:response regulator n=1 Tax=Sphingomonas arvum TaxID=2992113 RepID=UPI0029F5A523|nr:response regulator transcription factor [Sphingomonas sp. BN140010]